METGDERPLAEMWVVREPRPTSHWVICLRLPLPPYYDYNNCYYGYYYYYYHYTTMYE